MSFTIKNAKSGSEFSANEDESILDAALRQSIVFPYSCRGGTCGSCKARLVAGDVHYTHQPQALSEDDVVAGKVLLCQAQPRSDVTVEATEIAASAEIQIKILPCRIGEMEQLAHDVMELSLKLPASQRFDYLAGQYIDIMLRDGRRRSFSMASRPQVGQNLELHIRHIPGGHFSSRVFDSMQVKDLLRFQGPFGTFFLREDSDRPVILMAGGTGLAPIKAILEQAFHKQSSRQFQLFWGVRQARDLYYHQLMLDWAAEFENFSYIPVLSEPGTDDDWQGETGFVHQTVLKHNPDLSNCEVYACGPPIMIDSGRELFTPAGMDPELLFYDSFDYAVDE
jgi:CDP-4-dehydro-6-deoxyglucose reductase, E3